MFKGFLHSPTKSQYADYSPDVKVKVELMLSFVREVLSSDKEDVFEYLGQLVR